MGVMLGFCRQATAEVMALVQAALPETVEELSLTSCYELRSFPRLSGLTQLRTLDLYKCNCLPALPKLPPHLPWRQVKNLPDHLDRVRYYCALLGMACAGDGGDSRALRGYGGQDVSGFLSFIVSLPRLGPEPPPRPNSKQVLRRRPGGAPRRRPRQVA